MQPETKFKEKVIKILSKLDNVWLVKVQQKTTCGTPDILMCVNGKFVAWELKVGINKASPLQKYNIDCIIKAGGYASVVSPDTLSSELLYLTQHVL